MSTRNLPPATKFAHLNSTLTTVAAAQTFASKTNFVDIFNPDTTNSVKVSFDGGTTFRTIPPGAAFGFDCDDFMNRNTMHLKSSASTIAVEVTYGYEV